MPGKVWQTDIRPHRYWAWMIIGAIVTSWSLLAALVVVALR